MKQNNAFKQEHSQKKYWGRATLLFAL